MNKLTKVLVLTLSLALIASLTAAAASSPPDLTRSSFLKGILIEATYRSSTTDQTALNWDIAITTHSGNLSRLDLTDRAVLRTERGEVGNLSFTWKLNVTDAHHPSGRLTAIGVTPSQNPMTAADTGYVELVLKGLTPDDEAERIFRWDRSALPPVDMSAHQKATESAAAPKAGATGHYAAYISNATDGTVSVIDTRSRELIRTLKTPNLVALDTVTGQLRRVTEGINPVGHIAFAPDGRRFYVANLNTDTLTVMDVSTLQVLDVVEVGDGPNESRPTPDNRYVFVANWLASNVAVVDTSDWQVITQIDTGQGTHGVAVSPDGTSVWITNRVSNDIAVIDVSTLKVVARIKAGEYANHVAFTPDGRQVYVTNGKAAQAMIFDAATRMLIGSVPVSDDPHEIAFGPVPEAAPSH